MLVDKLIRNIRNIPLSPMRRMYRYMLENPGVISFASGEPDFDTPRHIREAIKKALDEGHTHYISSNGLPELREAIADYYRREKNVKTDSSEVLVTAGSGQALDFVISSLIVEGDEVLVPDPGYLTHVRLIEANGGIPVAYPLQQGGDYSINIEEVEGRIGPRTKAMILCNPNNPTGSLLSKDTLKAITEVATKHDLIVISDEIYERILFDSGKHHSIGEFPGARDRTIIINGFSKTYAMTGLRLGYLIAEREYVSEVTKWFAYVMISVATAVQWGAVAALRGPQDCVREMVAEYDARRKMLVQGLNGINLISCSLPAATFYVFPDVSTTGMGSEGFVEHLLRKGRVAAVPGVHFGSRGEGHIRLSFAVSRRNIMEGLERIRDSVRSLH